MHDARMRMRRHDGHGVGEAVKGEIVHVTTATGEKAPVFHAAHRLADAVLRCIHAVHDPPMVVLISYRRKSIGCA